MAEAPDGGHGRAPPLLVWALATFHVAVLVAVAVGVLYASGTLGNQIAALDTSVGVVAYLSIWGITWWTNRRMLDDLGPAPLGRTTDRVDVVVGALRWGGVTGLLVFLPIYVLALVFFAAAGGLEAVPILLVGGAVALVLAVGAGVLVGGVLALLDLALARLVRVWLPESAVDRGTPDPDAPTDTP